MKITEYKNRFGADLDILEVVFHRSLMMLFSFHLSTPIFFGFTAAMVTVVHDMKQSQCKVGFEVWGLLQLGALWQRCHSSSSQKWKPPKNHPQRLQQVLWISFTRNMTLNKIHNDVPTISLGSVSLFDFRTYMFDSRRADQFENVDLDWNFAWMRSNVL